MKMKHIIRPGILFLFVVVVILMQGCAHHEIVTPCLQGHTYGFWGGLWHGLIAPFDLIGMIFRDGITMYAQNNNGAWYAFGFLIGSGGWGLLGGKGFRKKRNQ